MFKCRECFIIYYICKIIAFLIIERLFLIEIASNIPSEFDAMFDLMRCFAISNIALDQDPMESAAETFPANFLLANIVIFCEAVLTRL